MVFHFKMIKMFLSKFVNITPLCNCVQQQGLLIEGHTKHKLISDSIFYFHLPCMNLEVRNHSLIICRMSESKTNYITPKGSKSFLWECILIYWIVRSCKFIHQIVKLNLLKIIISLLAAFSRLYVDTFFIWHNCLIRLTITIYWTDWSAL